LDTGHGSVNVDDIEVLHFGNKSKLLDRYEEFHIYNSLKMEPGLILNKQLNFTANPIYELIQSTI